MFVRWTKRAVTLVGPGGSQHSLVRVLGLRCFPPSVRHIVRCSNFWVSGVFNSLRGMPTFCACCWVRAFSCSRTFDHERSKPENSEQTKRHGTALQTASVDRTFLRDPLEPGIQVKRWYSSMQCRLLPLLRRGLPIWASAKGRLKVQGGAGAADQRARHLWLLGVGVAGAAVSRRTSLRASFRLCLLRCLAL